jgi:hypothetical protein
VSEVEVMIKIKWMDGLTTNKIPMLMLTANDFLLAPENGILQFIDINNQEDGEMRFLP